MCRAGLTGEGMRVSILDDGINPEHPDIAANYWAKGSWDISFNTSNPMPLVPEDSHGTRAAGTAAATYP
jgi:subtilisin family serine protease